MPTTRATKRTVAQSARAATMASALPAATMTTLAHRLPMLFGAAFDGKAWTDPEFQRMLTEKVQAGLLASTAMGKMMTATQSALTRYLLDQTSANMAIAATPSINPWQVFGFATASSMRLAGLTATLGDIGSKSAVGGLGPTHKKVVANAKRLSSRAASSKRR